MVMKVREINTDDLTEIGRWWECRGEGAMPAGILPPLGFVAVDDAGPCAAVWLYEPRGCAVVFLDWLVSRPGLGMKRARAACRAVYAAAEEAARPRGARMIFASAARPAMAREAVALGFSIASAGMTHLAKCLPEDH